jgi:3-isopropylmalate dehydrogenase
MPEKFDVLVTSNMFGDIITDLAAITQGGLGIAAGGNISPEGVSMFEPIGGTAPDHTGKNTINPLAAILSMAMLLEQAGQSAAAQTIEKAVSLVTPKMPSQAAGEMGHSTTEIGDLVVENL